MTIMQTLILAILVISNVSGGIEIAADYEDAWAEFGGLKLVADFQPDLTDGDHDPDEEADCDHCCHGGAHFAGVIVSRLILPYVAASSGVTPVETPHLLVNRSPPTPPPNI
jgi:hypothetical protein